jgi:hypothetical protein
MRLEGRAEHDDVGLGANARAEDTRQRGLPGFVNALTCHA